MDEVETFYAFVVDGLRVDPGIIIHSAIGGDDGSYMNTERVPCATWEQAHWLVERLTEAHDRIIFRELLKEGIMKLSDMVFGGEK